MQVCGAFLPIVPFQYCNHQTLSRTGSKRYQFGTAIDHGAGCCGWDSYRRASAGTPR